MSLNPPAKGVNSLAVCPPRLIDTDLWLLLRGCQPVIWGHFRPDPSVEPKDGSNSG